MLNNSRALVGLGDLGLPILYDVRVSVSINREFEFVMMVTRLSPHTFAVCVRRCEKGRQPHIEVFESLTSHSSGHSSSTHISHCRVREFFLVHIDFTTSCLCDTCPICISPICRKKYGATIKSQLTRNNRTVQFNCIVVTSSSIIVDTLYFRSRNHQYSLLSIDIIIKMVRFPRIGNRGSKIALYTGFTTLIAINGYIAVKALAGDPVSMSSLSVFCLKSCTVFCVLNRFFLFSAGITAPSTTAVFFVS